MHLVLAVEDVDRAYDFYRSAFGWEHHLQWPGEYVELELPEGDWLGLYRREAEERLRAAGAKALSPRSERGWGDEAAYFADPDGNVVAVGKRLD